MESKMELEDRMIPRNLLEEDEAHVQEKKSKKKSGGFESMNLIFPVYKAIKAKGFNVPTPIQRKAIPPLLEGRDIVACARTGSGKTAAFLIPMVNRLVEHSTTVGARALIVLPTRELALQTVSVLKQFTKFTNLRHCLIVGGHGLEGQFEGLASNPDIIIATPGRLTQHINETGLALSKVEFLIFDEADYLFEMGFADQMKVILKKVSNNRQTLMFSATIPEQLSQFARAGLKEYVFCKLDQEYTLNENMEVSFIVCKPNEKVPGILYLLEKIIPKDETNIIFCPTKYHVDLCLEIFEKYRISSVGIYGKMDQLQRKDAIQEFKTNNVRVLIVTDLAARGIDMPNINNVIHFDFPAQPKIFIHRSGRTARAGRKGKTYGLVSMTEVCYVAEILLYVGRKASIDKKELERGDNSKVYTGMLPSYLLTDYQNEIQLMLKDSPDLEKINDIATKAYQKFIKTRTSASKASVKNSFQVQTHQVHPLFQGEEVIQEQQDILNQLRNYRPKESYLEYFKNRAALKGKVKQDEADVLNNAISNMRNIQKINKQNQERQQKAKEQQEQLQKQLEQDKKDQLQEIQDKIAESNFNKTHKTSENDIELEEDLEESNDDYKIEKMQDDIDNSQDIVENDDFSKNKKNKKEEDEATKGMTKKQKKAYIKKLAEERRLNPEKFEQPKKETKENQKKEENKLQESQGKQENKEFSLLEQYGEKNQENNNKKRKNSKSTEEVYNIDYTDHKSAGVHLKRAKLTDFKHPTQYISDKPQNSLGAYEKDDQITNNDVQQFIVGEDADEILANKRKTVWDSKKKKYVMNQLPGLKGRQERKDQEDMKHRKKDGGKQIFKKWTDKNQVRLQKDGEEEDQDNIHRAQSSFKQRALVSKGYRFDSKQNIKSELKNPAEILKGKKQEKKTKLKHMEKGKRATVLEKIKAQKKRHNSTQKDKIHKNSKMYTPGGNANTARGRSAGGSNVGRSARSGSRGRGGRGRGGRR